MKTILKKGTDTGNIINNQNRKGTETMKQENEILVVYEKKMRIFKNLGTNQGVEKRKNLMQDILNESCIKMITISKEEKIKNVEHLFNRIIRNTTIDKLRSFNTESQIIEFENSFDTFDTDLLQYNQEYQNFKELLKHVYKKLNRIEKTLFNLYHVKTNSMQFIADILHTDKMDISRQIRKLNKKLYRMKLKDLFFVPFVAPQDKKLPSYGMSQPNDHDHVKVVNHFKETMYIYKTDMAQYVDYDIDMKQYKQTKQPFKNDFEYVNDRCSIKHGVYLTPVKCKGAFDIYDIMQIDTGSGIDYRTFKYNRDFKGDVQNTYGIMNQFNKLGKRYNDKNRQAYNVKTKEYQKNK